VFRETLDTSFPRKRESSALFTGVNGNQINELDSRLRGNDG
jgi:hypothetical protein